MTFRPQRRKFVGFMGNLMLAGLVAILIVCCGRKKESATHPLENMFGFHPSSPIHFIVPNGFRGEIRITEDKTNGIVPPVTNGVVEIAVPASGRLALKDWGLLFQDHRESASYANGTPIPNPDLTPAAQQFPANEIAFWALGTSYGTGFPQETVIYFVGTDDERKGPR